MEHMAAVGHVGLLAVDEGWQVLAVDEGLLAATVGHVRLLAVDEGLLATAGETRRTPCR